MAAGIPQMIMPMGFDQLDNAHRIVRLDAGDFLLPSRFTEDRLASGLKDLLGNPKTALACKQLAGRLCGVDSLEVACDVIEASHRS
jgi:UDP:flavonoid glycosyltransferase YjiC (YdhE family)